jgi:tRNA splicing ligase
LLLERRKDANKEEELPKRIVAISINENKTCRATTVNKFLEVSNGTCHIQNDMLSNKLGDNIVLAGDPLSRSGQATHLAENPSEEPKPKKDRK